MKPKPTPRPDLPTEPEFTQGEVPSQPKPTLEQLWTRWFWLRSTEELKRFESDPWAQGYEVLRRHPSRALKPGDYLPVLGPNSPVFREPWPKLNEWEQAYIRSCWKDELVRFGLVHRPPIINTKAIYFRCDQPPEHLYRAAQSVIESAIRLRERYEADSLSEANTGPVPWQTLRERTLASRIEEASKSIRKPAQPKKPSDPSIVFGSDGTLVIPRIERRPRTDGRRPRTPRQFRWEAQDSNDPTDVVLYLPRVAEGSSEDEDHSSTLGAFLKQKGLSECRRKERPMYADEILACFRTFLTKPPRDFAEHRRRARQQVGRLRRREPRSISLGVVAFDFRQAMPKDSFKVLAEFLFKKTGRRLAVSERQLWTGLSSGLAAIKKLHSGLYKTAMR
jgi:hypothetical protein